MATNLVNLDAMIPRQDFEVNDEEQFESIQTLQIRDLEPGFFYSALRKPDFQRETSSWSPKKICEFIRTFLDGELIPSIILWQAGSQIFVIDGSHRLSALIAWVHDDYGDNKLSRTFFENVIPPEQEKAARALRTMITKEIGAYSEYKQAATTPGTSPPEVIARANRLGSRALQLQWVTGDAKNAESSFFKINQSATPIDPTELLILRSRHKASAVAARSILRAGTGHKYWSGYSEQNQDEIIEIGNEVYQTLFKPPLNTPIKTLDMPVGGRGYSAGALPLTFDLVNLSNEVRVRGPKSDPTLPLEPDEDGSQTIEFLRKTRSIVRRISGLHPSSLGLHPALYFYSKYGRFQPTAFLAMVNLVKDFQQKGKFKEFTKKRYQFEEFLLAHRTFANQVTSKYGSGAKGCDRLKAIYSFLIDQLLAERTGDDILTQMYEDDRFRVVTAAVTAEEANPAKSFTTETKSAVFLKAALENPLRCKLCNGLIHYNSITVDHIVRKEDGGLGVIDNGQLAHPYCNSTVKN